MWRPFNKINVSHLYENGVKSIVKFVSLENIEQLCEPLIFDWKNYDFGIGTYRKCHPQLIIVVESQL